MPRQVATLVVSAVLAIGLLIVGAWLPAPYVRLVPGPVGDTLGLTKDGHPLIQIKGAKVAATTGKIFLVTVSEYGSPGHDLKAGDVITGWWNKTDAVVPDSVLFPPSETAKQAEQQDALDMTQSQGAAKVAALRYLGYKLRQGADVAAVIDGSAAAGKLHTDDVIVAIDGKNVTGADALLTILKTHHAGDHVVFTVNRNGSNTAVPLVLGKPRTAGGPPTIGIGVADGFATPFEIDIDPGKVGGPSAGMAFALGIIDKLSDGDLTGGRTIAGTGTIDINGNVGPIGGVIQKMAGARSEGATVFLVPKDNCAEARKSVPHGLQLVKVTTLSDAVASVKAIRAGSTNVPSCAAS